MNETPERTALYRIPADVRAWMTASRSAALTAVSLPLTGGEGFGSAAMRWSG
jgi:hypothetical protein